MDEKNLQTCGDQRLNSLTTSVTIAGKLENVQPIGAAPHGVDLSHSEPFATVAFLMAASEVYGAAKW